MKARSEIALHPPLTKEPVSGRLSVLISQLHTAVDLDGFWKASLALLNLVVPHHSCSLLYGITGTHQLNARHQMPGARAERRSVSNLLIVQAFLARHPGIKLYTFKQVLSEDPSAHERRLAQQSTHLGSWEDFVHLAFWDESRPDAVLSVRRGKHEGPFTPKEIATLQSLHPVIEAGLQRLRSLAEERSQHLSIERFLAEVPVPVLFIDSNVRLVHASREGYAACSEWNFGKKSARLLNPRRSFKLPEAIAAGCRHLAENLPAAGASQRPLRVQHRSNPRLVAQIVVELPQASPWARPVYRVLFLTESSIDDVALSAKPSAMALLQRLTTSERRVALLVTEGFNNTIIAERLGKSARTVECQLTDIYSKLDVKNRVQLTRLLI